MAKKDFPVRRGVVREAVKEDILYFALPAIVILVVALSVCGLSGWDGIGPTLRTLFGEARTPVNELVGLCLIVGGFGIAIVAVGTLRRSYSSTLVIREGQKLVTNGIYRYTRHPVYLGVLIVCFGIAVQAASVPGGLVMAILIPLFLKRIAIEERLLTEEFGESYLTYRTTTAKLVPFIG